MIRWILQDVKRTLKSKKSFLLFFVMIISVFSFVTNNLNQGPPLEEDNNTVIEHMSPLDEYRSYQFFANYVSYECYIGEFDISSDDCENFRIYNKMVEDTLALNDEKELMLLDMYLLDTITDGFANYYLEASDKTREFLDKTVLNIDKTLKDKERVKELTKDKFPPVEMQGVFREDTAFFNYFSDNLKTQLLFFENNISNDVQIILAPSFFTVNYLQENYLILIVITLLVIYDSFFRDFKSGVTKTILSSPTRRFRYVIMKSISSMLSILVIVLIPIILGFIYLRFTLGFDLSYYPVSISNTTLNGIEPNLKFAPFMSDNMTPEAYSRYTSFCRVGPVGNYPIDMVGYIVDSSNIDCSIAEIRRHVLVEVSVKEVIFLIGMYSLLVILFIASLNSLFSLLFDSPILNISISGGFIAIGMVLNKLLIGNSILRVLPTTFLNPGDLIFGTVPYTYYNGVITLGIWTLIIFIATYIITKKKDFAH